MEEKLTLLGYCIVIIWMLLALIGGYLFWLERRFARFEAPPVPAPRKRVRKPQASAPGTGAVPGVAP